MKPTFLVSACLVGANTRYDGENSLDPDIIELVQTGIAIPVCPEQLGGLETPRAPSEIVGGSGHEVLAGVCRVINKAGQDVTGNFIKGAEETLKLAEAWQTVGAILKARSPSCGIAQIYDGTFQGKLTNGPGVTAALLMEAGFILLDENTWRKYKCNHGQA
ncbi:MAG: DUF523 domain-containing protein [Firmicutes bacterium]|nr:DUF523 domain-containing protein [Bacillota bacterium]